MRIVIAFTCFLALTGCETLGPQIADRIFEIFIDSVFEAAFGPDPVLALDASEAENIRGRCRENAVAAGKTVEARYRAREAEPGGRRGLKKVERPLAVGLERSATESRCLDRFGLDD
jgi:hypothetical protein